MAFTPSRVFEMIGPPSSLHSTYFHASLFPGHARFDSVFRRMFDLLVHWFLSSASLLIVAFLFQGIEVNGLGAALIAPIVIGLINATLGIVLKVITLPLTLLTLGIFWLIINALMLQFAAVLVPGFYVAGFFSAFFGAIVLSIINMLLRSLV
jgi:putative membrane protein